VHDATSWDAFADMLSFPRSEATGIVAIMLNVNYFCWSYCLSMECYPAWLIEMLPAPIIC
jgi:hypothetical protein